MITALFFLFLLISVLASVGGRLLGFRLPWLRAFTAALLGMVAGAGLLAFVFAKHASANVPFPLLFAGIALFSTMAFMVLMELMARPRPLIDMQDQHASRPGPLRAIGLKMARTRRYIQICKILARHGLLSYVRRITPAQARGQRRPSSWLAKSLRGTLEEAGGIFVKLGQVLSTRQDLLPSDVVAELATLQDQVSLVPQEQIMRLLEEELGGSAEQFFLEFHPQPLAAASIAQVYRARLMTGEQVIVKVQRPGIRAQMERDIDILLKFALTLERRTTWGKKMQAVELAQGFAESLKEELDFQVEARNTRAVAASLPPAASIRVPTIYQQLSGSRVMVAEWLDGANLRNAEALITEACLDRVMLARTLLHCFLRQILGSGIFHADPHPGNIMVLRDGTLGLIDFGVVGRLDPLQQSALRRIFFAVHVGDGALLSQALLDIAEGREDINEERFERALSHLLVQRFGSHMPLDARAFSELFHVLFAYGIAFPPVIGGVFRAIATLEGTLQVLAPEFSLIDETRSFAAEFLKDQLKPASLWKTLEQEVVGVLPILHRLPRRLDKIVAALERDGSLSAGSRFFTNAGSTQFIRFLVSNAILAVLSSALGVMAALFLNGSGGPHIATGITLLQAIGYVALVLSAVLMMRVIIAIARDQPR